MCHITDGGENWIHYTKAMESMFYVDTFVQDAWQDYISRSFDVGNYYLDTHKQMI